MIDKQSRVWVKTLKFRSRNSVIGVLGPLLAGEGLPTARSEEAGNDHVALRPLRSEGSWEGKWACSPHLLCSFYNGPCVVPKTLKCSLRNSA